MIKSGSPAEDERFSLTDDTTARVFTVSITDLRTEDEGRYWCAVKRTLSLMSIQRYCCWLNLVSAFYYLLLILTAYK